MSRQGDFAQQSQANTEDGGGGEEGPTSHPFPPFAHPKKCGMRSPPALFLTD